MPDKKAPCVLEKCSWCCDPVKIGPRSKHAPSELKIPVDASGNPLWKKREEVLVPADDFETQVIDTYDCVNFDKETGLCADYENRPEICKSTICIKDSSKLSLREQRKKFTEADLIKIKKT